MRKRSRTPRVEEFDVIENKARRLQAEDVIEFYGINEGRIFSAEPKWLHEAIDEQLIFLDDSDEKLKVRTGEAGTLTILEPGGFLIRQTVGSTVTFLVEN